MFDPNRDMHWEFEQSHSLFKDFDQQFKAKYVLHGVFQSSFTFVQCVDINLKWSNWKQKTVW